MPSYMPHITPSYAEARLDLSRMSTVVEAPLHLRTEAFKDNA